MLSLVINPIVIRAIETVVVTAAAAVTARIIEEVLD